MYHDHRNLCEDLVCVNIVKEQEIKICADIDISPNADEDQILARIYFEIDKYFSPEIRTYSLNEMLDKGYSIDDIFQGPIPHATNCINIKDSQGGFIDYKELELSDLRTEVRLSDVINIIMSIDGVLNVKEISISNCGTELSDENSRWIICVEDGHKPVRCDASYYKFSKGNYPLDVKHAKVDEYYKHLVQLADREKAIVRIEDLPIPSAAFTDVSTYSTIQNDFPDAYGITDIGLSERVSLERKSKVKQFSAYLLFFDQVLATYFSHLAEVKNMLSVDVNLLGLVDGQSYNQDSFITQEISDLKLLKNLVDDKYSAKVSKILNSNLMLDDLGRNISAHDLFIQKKNDLLDHLISRFAENFNDYAFVMNQLYGDNSEEIILSSKANFLLSFPETGCQRATGYNKCKSPISTEDDAIWDTKNVSGVELRIAQLNGMTDSTRRDLVTNYFTISEHLDIDGNTYYNWRLTTDGSTVLIGVKNYYHVDNAIYDLYRVKTIAIYERSNAFVADFTTSPAVLNILDTNNSEHIATIDALIPSTNAADLESQIDSIINDLKSLPSEEGIYLIEHILMLPDDPTQQCGIEEESNDEPPITEDFLYFCSEPDCIIDPYSFRVTIVLPGWTSRFADRYFRKYMEKIIRDELPSHIVARICWPGYPRMVVSDTENDMVCLQTDYQSFLRAIHCGSSSTTLETRTAINKLKETLSKLNSIFPKGTLHDCSNEETEARDGKIILGGSHI